MDELLVIPLGFTNVCDTFQLGIQSWRFLLLFLDAIIRYNKTWEDYVRKLCEPRGHYRYDKDSTFGACGQCRLKEEN
jgi:hypothetical protein